jgi:ribosomal protein S18 acetylase RimI-like enzyme
MAAMPETERARIRRGSIADLAALEPLWLSLHHHHAGAMPELGPYVDDTRSWAVRSRLYRELLARPTTVLLLVYDGAAPVGYGLAYVMTELDQAWLDDTWSTTEPVGEIETLAVLPRYRGRGLGTRLLDTLETEMAAAGVANLVLGVLSGNTAAIRLYSRHGYLPTFLYMSKLRGRARTV